MTSPLILPQLTATDTSFPDVETALHEPDGLLAWDGDLSPARLLNAYQNGIFPWCSEDEPLLWWSPSQRMVLTFDNLHISHSLKKRLKKMQRDPQGTLEVRLDSAFEDVIRACASKKRSGQHGTWIAEDFIQAYTQLHYLGYAHSVETWCDNQLVGGLYGVSIGKMFYGESMFSYQTDSSKIALVFLMYYLVQQGVELIDCQQDTPHLTSMGGHCIARKDFSAHLQKVCGLTPVQWATGFLSPDILSFK